MSDTRWTYKVIEFKRGFLQATPRGDQMEDELNKLGTQGWELVSVITSREPFHPTRAFLKRPLH